MGDAAREIGRSFLRVWNSTPTLFDWQQTISFPTLLQSTSTPRREWVSTLKTVGDGVSRALHTITACPVPNPPPNSHECVGHLLDSDSARLRLCSQHLEVRLPKWASRRSHETRTSGTRWRWQLKCASLGRTPLCGR